MLDCVFVGGVLRCSNTVVKELQNHWITELNLLVTGGYSMVYL